MAIIVDPDDYPAVLDQLDRAEGPGPAFRFALAQKAFAHTGRYDTAIAATLATVTPGPDGFARGSAALLPAVLPIELQKVRDLRYGENPHQRGALYADATGPGPLAGAELLVEGKEMSFNNWLDVEAALTLAADLDPFGPAAVIVKHNNPCGAAVATSLAGAYGAALESDPVSAFGGIVAFSREADGDAARAMADVFTEVVVAPSFAAEAVDVFAERRGLRIVRAPLPTGVGLDLRILPGGALAQDRDHAPELDAGLLEVVSSRAPSEDEWRDLRFAWVVAMRVKSNAIVFAKDRATVGVGAGQMSRVDASFLAARKAGDRAVGSVMASDAFFPFPDAVEVAAEAGVTAVVHPGGSVRDAEVLAAAEARAMAVVVTGRRHFRH